METSVHSWKWAGGAGIFEPESTRDKVAKETLVACNLRRMNEVMYHACMSRHY